MNVSLLGPVQTNPFSKESGAVLLRFLFCSVFFRYSTLQRRICFENAFIPSVRMLKWTHTQADFNISAREIGPKLKPHGSVCPPFWIVTVEWSGARSCLFWWRRRFQIASFSSFTLENSVFKEHRFFKSLRAGVVVRTIAVSGAK